MDTIPSCMGCKTSFKSSRVFDTEEQLAAFLKDIRGKNQSSIVFSGNHSFFKQEDIQEAIKEANRVAIQKVSTSNRYRYIEKVALLPDDYIALIQ